LVEIDRAVIATCKDISLVFRLVFLIHGPISYPGWIDYLKKTDQKYDWSSSIRLIYWSTVGLFTEAFYQTIYQAWKRRFNGNQSDSPLFFEDIFREIYRTLLWFLVRHISTIVQFPPISAVHGPLLWVQKVRSPQQQI
jgi:hypothetical protein